MTKINNNECFIKLVILLKRKRILQKIQPIKQFATYCKMESLWLQILMRRLRLNLAD